MTVSLARAEIQKLQEWALDSPRGTFVVSNHSTHAVPPEDPDLIVWAIGMCSALWRFSANENVVMAAATASKKNASNAVHSGGYLSFRGCRTWYETTGDLRNGVPLVLLHGGPGIPGGAYAQLMSQLADRRPVVRYDQLGCGRSDRPNDPSLWCIQTFVEELAALRDTLGLDQNTPSRAFLGRHARDVGPERILRDRGAGRVERRTTAW
jgi:hypothetical protein